MLAEVEMKNLQERLDELTIPGRFYEKLDGGAVRCYACAHRCLIKPGRRGICQVRFNHEGELRVPWGYVSALNVDPIEKKPFSHLLPGTDALTFGMLGCDFHCDYCQNWEISQEFAGLSAHTVHPADPETLTRTALHNHAGVVVSSYNEPLITSEWALDVFAAARQVGLKTAYVSNGNATPGMLSALRPHLDGYKVDLKTMQDRNYRKLGGVLNNVLDTIRTAHGLGVWVEVVTLIIPGFNDDMQELWDAARFLAGVSPDIPWHLTAFHPDYKRTDPPATHAEQLIRAAEIGQEAGLHYVYAGNLPGRVGSLEDTFCPGCGARLIARRGYTLHEYNLSGEGRCQKCGQAIAGVWSDDPASVRTFGAGAPYRAW